MHDLPVSRPTIMAQQQHNPRGNTDVGDPGDSAHPAASDRRPVRNLVSWILIGLSIAVALSAAGLWLAQRSSTDPGRVEVIIPTPAPIVVHVVGAVLNEGVYTLPPGSRIANAIDAAGGANADADLSRLNLAARAPDGARLNVPIVATDAAGVPDSGTTQANNEADEKDSPNDTGASSGELVDLNSGSLSALMSLPGIGETRATAIIAFRELKGPIVSADDLLEIDGIGQATVDNIRAHVAQPETTQANNETAENDSPADAGAVSGELVDLNTGSLSALMSLPGIGETRATAIIAFRELNGPIVSADDLLEIDGIGQATVDNIRPFVVQR